MHHKTKIYIFLDESGKNNDKPNLIGTISIPKSIYHLPEFQKINDEIQQKTIH